MQAALVVCVVAGLAVLSPTSAHQFKFGGCKTSTPVANFDPVKFNGTWFVHKKVATTSSCLALIFNWDEDKNEFEVQEMRVPAVGSALPIDLSITNVGRLTPVSTNSGTMKLVWEGVVANLLPYTYTVGATDYDNYALDVECQNLMSFAKRVSASILTRSQDSPTATQMKEWEAELGAMPDVTLSKLKSIDQGNCASLEDANYNIRYDKNGVSLMSQSGNEQVVKLSTPTDVKEYIDHVVETEKNQ